MIFLTPKKTTIWGWWWLCLKNLGDEAEDIIEKRYDKLMESAEQLIEENGELADKMSLQLILHWMTAK